MITFTKDRSLTLQQMKAQPYLLVKAVKDAVAGNNYTIARKEGETAELLLMSKAKYDAAVAAVDSENSLPIVTKSVAFDMHSAAIRCDELYHLVLGKPVYTSQAPQNKAIASGFQHKIDVKGTQLDNVVENLTSADGEVVATKPIASAASVSARKSGADLVITSVDLALGVVVLEDEEAPIEDDIAVELRYQATDNLIVEIRDAKKVVIAVILSAALNAQLAAAA